MDTVLRLLFLVPLALVVAGALMLAGVWADDTGHPKADVSTQPADVGAAKAD